VGVAEKLSSEGMKRFTECYDTYYSLVFSSVLSRTGNYDDSEDITQEVFIRLHDKIDEVEEPRKWVFGCLRNVVMDHYKRKHNRDVDIDVLLNDVSMGYVNGFREARVIIKDCIDQVFEEHGYRDAAIFELVAMYNYSFREAARHLNLNYKQVIYRYRNVAARLMEKLKEKGINEMGELL